MSSNEGVVVSGARIAPDTSDVLLRLVLPQMARLGRPTGHPQKFFTVADDGGAEAAGGVDIGVGDGDGGEVDHEDSKPKGLWNQDMNVRISSASLGISGWKKKNNACEHESADDFSTESCVFVVASSDDGVGTTTK